MPVTRPSSPQVPLHFHPCNYFTQKQLWIRGMTVGWQPHKCPVFQLEVGSTSSISPLSGNSSNVPPYESWESLTSQVSGAFWKILPTSYFLVFPVSILSAGPWGFFNPFPSLNTRSGSPFPPNPSPTPHGSLFLPDSSLPPHV